MTVTVTGTFERFGKKYDAQGNQVHTLLFVKLSGVPQLDHCWLPESRHWRRLKLRRGDCVSFDAILGYTEKGYLGDSSRFLMDCPPPPRTAPILTNITNHAVTSRNVSLHPGRKKG